MNDSYHISEPPGAARGPFCSACHGPRLPVPGSSYLHNGDCPALFNGLPVVVHIGEHRQLAIGSAIIADDYAPEDVALIVAMMLREAGRAWLALLGPEVVAESDHPAPDEVIAAAIELTEATGPADQATAGFRLSLALGDWLAEA